MKRKASKSFFARAAMTLLLALITTVSNATVTSVSSSAELITALYSSDNIQMTADIDLAFSVPISKTVTLDLNGHTLNVGSYSLNIDDDLTVKDTSADGNGVISGTGNYVVNVGNSTVGTMTLESGKISGTKNGIRVNSGSWLAIDGGEVSASSYYAITNYGGFVMNGGKVSSTGNFAIVDYGSFVMCGGEVSCTGNYVVNVSIPSSSSTAGTMTLESGKISAARYGVNVAAGCSLAMYGGEISATNGGVINRGSFVLNGGTITASSWSVYIYTNASFEMYDGTVVATGNGTAVHLYGDCSAVINGGTIEAQNGDGNSGGAGIVAFKNTELTITGGTITAYSMALAGNGSTTGGNDGTNAKFTIEGGTLTSTHDKAIYAPQASGEVTITDGTITGATSGIELRAGTLNIQGGTIIGNTESYDVSNADKGIIGSAVAVAQHTSKLPINVNISGGTLIGYLPLSEHNTSGNETTDLQKINYCVSGGLFHSTGTQAILIEDYLNGPFIGGGRFTYSVEDYLLTGYLECQDSENDPYFVLPNYLTDGVKYMLSSDLDMDAITYRKTLGLERKGKHQAWMVPFDYTITDADLDAFTFYKINMIANSPSPSVEASDEIWVFLKRMEAGDVLHANMPYVYKPKAEVTDYEFTTPNATLKAKNEGVIAKSETLEDVYSFYATYENTTATTDDPFYYVGIDGDISYGNNGTVTVGPFRWIIRKTSKFDGSTSYARKMHFYDGESSVDVTTGISSLTPDPSPKGEGSDYWFSLDGRRLNGQPTQSGVYVNNGKKVVFVP